MEYTAWRGPVQNFGVEGNIPDAWRSIERLTSLRWIKEGLLAYKTCG
jgi:hypothetical protein